jgi:hypothetical protein
MQSERAANTSRGRSRGRARYRGHRRPFASADGRADGPNDARDITEHLIASPIGIIDKRSLRFVGGADRAEHYPMFDDGMASAVRISDLAYVGSYNLTDLSPATILVPGV